MNDSGLGDSGRAAAPACGEKTSAMWCNVVVRRVERAGMGPGGGVTGWDGVGGGGMTGWDGGGGGGVTGWDGAGAGRAGWVGAGGSVTKRDEA